MPAFTLLIEMLEGQRGSFVGRWLFETTWQLSQVQWKIVTNSMTSTWTILREV
jgi:hypothetical protein